MGAAIPAGEPVAILPKTDIIYARTYLYLCLNVSMNVVREKRAGPVCPLGGPRAPEPPIPASQRTCCRRCPRAGGASLHPAGACADAGMATCVVAVRRGQVSAGLQAVRLRQCASAEGRHGATECDRNL